MDWQDDYKNRIGQHLKKIRLEKGLSIREVELQGDISRHVLSQIENAKKNMNITTFKKILNALDITEKEFFKDF